MSIDPIKHIYLINEIDEIIKNDNIRCKHKFIIIEKLIDEWREIKPETRNKPSKGVTFSNYKPTIEQYRKEIVHLNSGDNHYLCNRATKIKAGKITPYRKKVTCKNCLRVLEQRGS